MCQIHDSPGSSAPAIRNATRVLLCALGWMYAAAGAADEEVGAYFDEIPIVLTASRLQQSALDAPAPVTVVDREMIVSSGFTEIHDLLRLVPGFLVADWPDGSPIVTNHGLGDPRDRRIKVLIDGRVDRRTRDQQSVVGRHPVAGSADPGG